jgi:hypothetical protein
MPNNFITGVWFQPASSFSKWVGRGVNTLIGYESEGNPNSFYASTWKPAAIAAGLKYIVSWKDPRDGSHSAPGPLTAADNSDPNLLAVALPDEPNGAANMTPGQVLDMYIQIKNTLPNKPVFLNFDGWQTQYRPFNDLRCYCQGADWIAQDFHILNHGDGPEGIPKLGTVMDKLINAGAAAGGEKKYLSCVECADENLRVQSWVQPYPDVKAKMRGPTAAEMAQEVNTVIARKLAGIFWFADKIGLGFENFDNTTIDQAAAVTSINTMLLAR